MCAQKALLYQVNKIRKGRDMAEELNNVVGLKLIKALRALIESEAVH